MTEMTSLRHGVTVWVAPAEGPELASEQDAMDIIAALYHLEVDLVAIPVERFAERFFDMHSRLIGGFFSKLVNYGHRLAVVGGISRFVEASDVLRDVVYECNRGKDVWFVADLAELDTRLEHAAAR
jgi:hypothetical protein